MDSKDKRIAQLEAELAKWKAQPLYTKEQIERAYCQGENDYQERAWDEKAHLHFFLPELPPFTPEAADADR